VGSLGFSVLTTGPCRKQVLERVTTLAVGVVVSSKSNPVQCLLWGESASEMFVGRGGKEGRGGKGKPRCSQFR